MAKSNTPIILLVLVVATMLVATNASGCDNDINSLKETCLQFVGVDGPKLKPDQNCCNAIQRSDIPCVCTYLTPEVEKVISADKVVYVAQQCGRPLKPGSKCGSVVVHG
ncbi:Bifunctional inhibitor/lipid-transfer protein/seed storage 2S albumin superfamily protein [Rhynchospora pubera]|uniref:Bifunctional inhibitor/lipid-transfer protein/seed storage 2S albumin superfamily protein n=1 Tax=Rhynchospora pubera TaxID=906938 RepID=A0AAV8FGZ7_9POAL|nr:Bifunctional inhibitor/lipid-transfer protein/seed storage 2S albumin superfamily protein [Rhynchospora pubera]